jgi:hypothetical protein
MHCGEFRLLAALIPAEGLSAGNGLVYVSGKAPAGTQMVGRRRAGRMRRSNKRLFLDEVQLRRKRGLQLRCGRPKKLHRATLLRKPVSLLLGNVVSLRRATDADADADATQPPPTARVFLPPTQPQSPIASSSTSVSKLSVCDIHRIALLIRKSVLLRTQLNMMLSNLSAWLQ